MRDFITGLLFAGAISALGFVIAVTLAKNGSGTSTTNTFTAGWASALLHKSLESRGWF